MKDEAGLDRLAEADLVSEQDSRRKPARNFGRNIKLVRNEIDAATGKSPYFGFAAAMLLLECRETQIKQLGWIELPYEQSGFRLVDTDRVAEVRLANLTPAAAIIKEPITFNDGFHQKRFVLTVLDCVARLKPHTVQRSVRPRVLPLLAAHLEDGRYAPRRDGQDRAHSQFGLRVANPTLTGMKIICHVFVTARRSSREFPGDYCYEFPEFSQKTG